MKFDRSNDLRGFTLVELLVVLLVVGVLALLAIGGYQYFTTRARIAQALELADAARVRVEERLIAGTPPPADLLAEDGGRVDRVTAMRWMPAQAGAPGGAILVEMDLPVLGVRKVVALVAQAAGAGLLWRCTGAEKYAPGAAAPELLLPTSCREGSTAVAVTGGGTRPSAGSVAPQAASTPGISCPPAWAPTKTETVMLNAGQVLGSFAACATPCPAGQQRMTGNPLACVAGPIASAAPATAQGSAATASAPPCGGQPGYRYSDGRVVCDNPCASQPGKIWQSHIRSSSGEQAVDQCVEDCPGQGMTFKLQSRGNPQPGNWTVSCVSLIDAIGMPQAASSACAGGTDVPAGLDLSRVQFKAQECLGPPDICEKLNGPGSKCKAGELPYLKLVNFKDASRTVEVGCKPIGECFKMNDKFVTTDKCIKYDMGAIYTNDFQCEVCCMGDNCNTPGDSNVLGSCAVRSNAIIKPEFLQPFRQ